MKTTADTLSRLIRLKEAENRGKGDLDATRAAIAIELVGANIVDADRHARPTAHPNSGYRTPYEATADFAVELHRAIAWHATNIGRAAPDLRKYHPDSATAAMFRDVWEARQLCDRVGMPYAFFAQQTVMHWETLKRGRLPRPTQLCAPDVMEHVAALWAAPWGRLHDTLPSMAIDDRFDPNNHTGDSVQLAVLALIDERVAFASRVGMPVENVVARVLGTNISEVEARRRYGDDVVDRAQSIQARQQTEVEDVVDGLRDAGSSDAHGPTAGD